MKDEPWKTYAVELDNGLIVVIVENDANILDELVPRFEVSALLNDQPLLDPDTMQPMVYGANDEHELGKLMDHYCDLEVLSQQSIH